MVRYQSDTMHSLSLGLGTVTLIKFPCPSPLHILRNGRQWCHDKRTEEVLVYHSKGRSGNAAKHDHSTPKHDTTEVETTKQMQLPKWNRLRMLRSI